MAANAAKQPTKRQNQKTAVGPNQSNSPHRSRTKPPHHGRPTPRTPTTHPVARATAPAR